MPLKIGLTGNMGSGKTTVAKIFETFGVPVFYADDVTKQLMNELPALQKELVTAFGNGVYEHGELNRKYLAEIVFKQPEKLTLLNSITHPHAIQAANQWMQKQTTPYAIKEAAILFESNTNIYLDEIIGVAAPENMRMQRVQTRDGLGQEQILARMSKQMPQEEKMKRCNYVINNDGLTALLPQIEKLHKQLLNKANAL
jgi:dephospho-CoA kinase